MLLSVLSALARLDVDPWQEASALAGLPTEIATKRLASMIAAIPGWLSAPPDPGAIAARLIALLPGVASPKIALRETAKSGAFIYALFFLMAVMAGAQFMPASRQSPSHVDKSLAPASSTVLPQMPSPNSD